MTVKTHVCIPLKVRLEATKYQGQFQKKISILNALLTSDDIPSTEKHSCFETFLISISGKNKTCVKALRKLAITTHFAVIKEMAIKACFGMEKRT